MSKSSKVTECVCVCVGGGCLAPRLCFLYRVTLPSDHGNVAIRSDLAGNRFGKLLRYSTRLFTCLSAYSPRSLGRGAGSTRSPGWLRAFLCDDGYHMPMWTQNVGDAILQQPPQTREGHRVPWAVLSFRIAGSCREAEPWPTLSW